MPVIRIRISHEELAAIQRRADELRISVADLAYGALNCSMTHGWETGCKGRIDQAIYERGKDLPLWSDSARSVSIYEAMPDEEQHRGPKGAAGPAAGPPA